ncbi:MAG: hypothetical protein ACK6D2_01495, partial [Planctomycetota bacterium]
MAAADIGGDCGRPAAAGQPAPSDGVDNPSPHGQIPAMTAAGRADDDGPHDAAALAQRLGFAQG